MSLSFAEIVIFLLVPVAGCIPALFVRLRLARIGRSFLTLAALLTSSFQIVGMLIPRIFFTTNGRHGLFELIAFFVICSTLFLFVRVVLGSKSLVFAPATMVVVLWAFFKFLDGCCANTDTYKSSAKNAVSYLQLSLEEQSECPSEGVVQKHLPVTTWKYGPWRYLIFNDDDGQYCYIALGEYKIDRYVLYWSSRTRGWQISE